MLACAGCPSILAQAQTCSEQDIHANANDQLRCVCALSSRALLQATVADVELSNDRFKVGSNVHRLKVRAWQGLTAAAAFLSSSRQEQAATAALQELLPILAVNNPPSIKQYQEAIVAHLLLSHTTLIPELLLPHLVSLENGNPAKGSHILIAMQTALHAQPEQQAVLLPQVLKLLLPWTNHHTHNIRTFAQLGLCCILDAKPLDSWPGWREGLGPGGIDIVGHVQRFMVENVDFQRFRRAMGQGILSWSATDVTSPRRIFSTALHLAGANVSDIRSMRIWCALIPLHCYTYCVLRQGLLCGCCLFTFLCNICFALQLVQHAIHS
eukprot:GHRR01028136.1.p1 GENE.GHRR01028136.1~~GHRR01028136.1.p1  ORF type:complete len:325 (+),score=76.36 GHRR01028136.1:725-1699(+)